MSPDRQRRRSWDGQFKARLGLQLLTGEATAAELAAEHGISEKLLHCWRAEARQRALDIEPGQELAAAKRQLRRQQRQIKEQQDCIDFFGTAFPNISPVGNARDLPGRGSSKD